MTPYPHQKEISLKAFDILKEHMIVYLAMSERTGKTLTSILTCEHSPNIKNVLVITKKNALDGWNHTIQSYNPKINFVVTNYHQANKITNPNDFDLVILDEAHNYISGFPKVPKMWKDIAKLTKAKPIIYISATPSAQGSCLLYHQFKLNSWSPFSKWTTFYKWFSEFGILKRKFCGANDYSTCREEKVWELVKHLFISYSREDLGFKFEPKDELHYVDLNTETKAMYNELEKTRVLRYADTEITADTPMSLLTKLHQIEGGTLKFNDESFELSNREKIDYILHTWGDSEQVVIFYHYIAEKTKLERIFKKARVLQSTAFAEGVDLSMYEHLVVYSMNFSTAQYTQRRARQANLQRKTPINVHFLLVRRGISDQVYKTVAINKKNFVDKYFVREELV